MSGPPVVIRPPDWGRGVRLPALGLISGGSFDPEMVTRLKQAEGVPVHLVFPLKHARGAGNLHALLLMLRPLFGNLIDQVWVAYGGERPAGLRRLTDFLPQVKVFPVAR